jgi:hypothetical protein
VTSTGAVWRRGAGDTVGTAIAHAALIAEDIVQILIEMVSIRAQGGCAACSIRMDLRSENLTRKEQTKNIGEERAIPLSQHLVVGAKSTAICAAIRGI